jgi:hypothetical protein
VRRRARGRAWAGEGRACLVGKVSCGDDEDERQATSDPGA